MRFRLERNSPVALETDLEKFAKGAKSEITPLTELLNSSLLILDGKPTEAVLFRCTKNDFDDIEFVFRNINIKSKQKLLEAILLPKIRAIAAELRRIETEY